MWLTAPWDHSQFQYVTYQALFGIVASVHPILKQISYHYVYKNIYLLISGRYNRHLFSCDGKSVKFIIFCRRLSTKTINCWGLFSKISSFVGAYSPNCGDLRLFCDSSRWLRAYYHLFFSEMCTKSNTDNNCRMISIR